MARRRRRALAQAALALLLGACRGAPSSSPAPAATAEQLVLRDSASPPAAAQFVPSAAAQSIPSAAPPPSQALGDFVTLAVPGFRDAVISVPRDTRAPRRIALALHGNFDRPEWQCEVWRRITQASVWVLCPRGIPRRDVPASLDRWEWGSVAATKRELVAAIQALRARHPEHVHPGQLVFTGFSLGAILGARLIQDRELGFGAAVLIEGGYQGWTLAKAKSLVPGLRAVLFGCGQSECRNAYRYQLGPLFDKAGLPASMVADVKAGHTYDDPVAALIAVEWPALLAKLDEAVPQP